MINKLKRKFVLVAMVSFTIVLVLVSITINVSIRKRNNLYADAVLQIISENVGISVLERDKIPRSKFINPGIQNPFELRYFVVDVGENGAMAHVNTDFTRIVNHEKAEEYVALINETKETSGYVDDFRYLVKPNATGYTIVGLDMSKQTDTAEMLFIFTIITVCASLVVVLVLLLFFSRRVTAPMIENIERQKQFITDASHEIKTPISIISANNEIIMLKQGESQWTQSIENQVERLEGLIGQLLQLSKTEETKKEVLEQVNVSDIVKNSAKMFDILMNKKSIDLDLKLKEDLVVCGYQQSIEKLVLILLENIARYTPKNGKAEILVDNKTKEVRFKNDTDEQILEDPNRLFDRFYRRESSRSRELGGSGIGLSVAKAVADAHGAALTAETTEKSITFKISFK